jgi:ankyrin repeat protein
MTNESPNGFITVNVGTPGNVRSLPLDAGKVWTVAEVLAWAELSADSYETRLNGQPATVATIVSDGQTLLLIAAVRGNFDDEHAQITVNVGTPGNVQKMSLDAGKTWTVAEVLAMAELSSDNYEMRLLGQPATDESLVTDGQTLLLIAAVRGN